MTDQRRGGGAPEMPADAAVARRGRRDAGDETARNFRYQHSYGVILLTAASRGELPYAAIWCEMHEDILAERLDGRFEAWQIKTRKPENGAWTNMDSDFLDALARFAPLRDTSVTIFSRQRTSSRRSSARLMLSCPELAEGPSLAGRGLGRDDGTALRQAQGT